MGAVKGLVNKVTGKFMKVGGALRSTAPPPNATKYAASRYDADELPSRVDLRPYLTPVEDQSAVNSCVANAIVGAYEYLVNRHVGEADDVSRLFVYYNARIFDGIEAQDIGSTITSSIRVLQEMGACTEETWPYNPNSVNEKPSEDAYEEAQEFLAEIAEEIDVDLYTMKHCLAEGYPFAFILRLFKSFSQAGRSGKVPMPDRNEERRETHGNHAMLCVGYSDESEMFIVRNSWGEDWGDRGYCYIPYDYLADPELCWDCWAIHQVTDLDYSEDIWEEEDETLYDEDDEDEDSEYEFYYDEDEEDDEENEDDEDDEEYEDDEDDEGEDEDYEDDDEEDEDEEYEDEDDEDSEIYVVQSGDSLSKIAEEFYDDGDRWEEIYAANRDIIGDDPDNIEPGMELEIPWDEEE